MSYRLQSDETVRDGIGRIVKEQVDKTRDELQDPDLSNDEKVHQARKRFKKIRAVLRLVRFELGDVYKEENVWYRDAGRLLSRARDSEAVIETFDVLREKFEDQLGAQALLLTRSALEDRRDHIVEEEQDIEDRLRDLVQQLQEARDRVETWPIEQDTAEAVLPGIRKVYQRGRKGYRKTMDSPVDEELHEWRKRVKYLRYHVRVLQDLWPRVMRSWRRALHDLTDLLGEHHDLAVLNETILQKPEVYGTASDLQLLFGLIERRQKELLLKAEPLGSRLYAEDADQFCERIQTYWDAWRMEQERRDVFAVQ